MTHILLVGGGHAHTQIIIKARQLAAAGAQITLISEHQQALYSGMLPGLLYGHYRFADCHVALPPLCQKYGVNFIHDSVAELDSATKTLTTHSGATFSGDIVSIDCGGTPTLEPTGLTAQQSVKPVADFPARWQQIKRGLKNIPNPRVALIGGGAGGIELAFALHHNLAPQSADIHLIQRGELLPGAYPQSARRQVRKALADANIQLREHCPVSAVTGTELQLAGQGSLKVDALLSVTASAAPNWLADAGLNTNREGFMCVNSNLQALGFPWLYGAGDCSHFSPRPLPKAGVFAIRQGQHLAQNLRRELAGKPLQPYRPQSRYLQIITLGPHRALACRGRWCIAGGWVNRLKRRIDRKHMESLRAD